MKESNEREERLGTLAAFGCYACWALFPIYWKLLSGVDALQILSHRIVWASIFSLAILAATGKVRGLVGIFRDRRRILSVAAAAVLITVNWGIYIWAVNSGRVTETSLGYYINPLVSIALGAAFFRERLDLWTKAAVSIAVAGIAAASVFLGRPPWISLLLAVTFAFYGLVKKKAGLDPLTGLAAETLVIAPLALLWLMRAQLVGQGSFGVSEPSTTLLLVIAGPVTAIPLLLFAAAANRIPLQRIGFMQYIAPTGQLALGLFVFGERLSPPLALAFVTVVVAVALYAFSRGRAVKAAASA